MARASSTPVLRSVAAAVGLGLMAFASSASAAPMDFADLVLADAPFAYWRFGEAPGATTAMDSSGFGHHGTYSGGVVTGSPGIGGGDTGALFGGIDGLVSVPNDPQLGPDFITMEALVRWDGPNPGPTQFQQRILEKSFFSGGEQASYSLSILPDGTIRVEFRAGGVPTTHTTAIALSPGDEAYIVATFDGTLVTIYLDGALVLAEAPALPGALQDGVNPLGIGSQTERQRPFLGLIDEVALYDYALSADAVARHARAISAVPEPGTMSLLGGGLLALFGAVRYARSRRS